MDDIVFPLFSSGDGVDLCHLSCDFNPFFKGGDDEPVSPKESQQSKQSEYRGKDGKKECGPSFKYCVNPVDDPTSKYHHKKVLRKIISGDDLKEGGGGFLHG